MDNVYLFSLIGIAGIFIVGIIICKIYSCFYKNEEEKVIVKSEEEIRQIVSQFAGKREFEVYYPTGLKKSYLEISKLVEYKLKPSNPNYKEKVSEKIIKIDFYTKLKL